VFPANHCHRVNSTFIDKTSSFDYAALTDMIQNYLFSYIPHFCILDHAEAVNYTAVDWARHLGHNR